MNDIITVDGNVTWGTKKYNVIYADPPWAYRNKRTGGSMKSGAVQHYDTMSLDELSSFPINNIANKNSVLFLWVPVPLLVEGLQVLKAWGFAYKVMLTWHKTGRFGMGYWFRNATEHVLLGVRGKVRAFRCQYPNIVEANVASHSQKPLAMRQLIEEATSGMDDPQRIELFARVSPTSKWDVWGNEVGTKRESSKRGGLENLMEGVVKGD